MKIKKLGHCCLIIEEEGKRIMIDPGKYSTLQNEENNLDILLITHEHTDHCHIDSIKTIVQNNPNIKIVTNSSVGKILNESKIDFISIVDGQEINIDQISLIGVGKTHKEVHPSLSTVEDVGFLINQKFFYPGDALHKPKIKPKIIAFPVAGSWIRVGEVIDWLDEIKPEIVIPVHDGILNENGYKALFGNYKKILLDRGIDFRILEENKEEEF